MAILACWNSSGALLKSLMGAKDDLLIDWLIIVRPCRLLRRKGKARAKVGMADRPRIWDMQYEKNNSRYPIIFPRFFCFRIWAESHDDFAVIFWLWQMSRDIFDSCDCCHVKWLRQLSGKSWGSSSVIFVIAVKLKMLYEVFTDVPGHSWNVTVYFFTESYEEGRVTCQVEEGCVRADRRAGHLTGRGGRGAGVL